MLVKDADRYHTALLIAEIPEANRIAAEHGQIAAEQVIQRVADRIKHSFRPVDHICRVSNARFAIVMSRVDSGIREQVKQKIDHLNDRLKAPDDGLPAASLAVGVAFADRVSSAGSILEDAEAALDTLKARGESGCAFH